MPNDSIFIWWKNRRIGRLNNPINDMGYIEGDWKPKLMLTAWKFTIKSLKLNPQIVLRNAAEGIRIKFTDDLVKGPTMHGYVIGLSKDRRLWIKMVSRNEDIQILLEKVPE